MVASRKPSTPLMTLSLLEAVQSAGGADAAAQEVRHRLERVTFAEVLQRVTAEERLRPEAAPAGGGAAEYSRRVRLTLHFDPAAAGVQRVELLLPLVEQLLPSLKRAMAKHAAAASKGRKAVTSRAARREAAPAAAGEGDEDGGAAGGEGSEGERRGRSGDDDGGGDGGGGGGDDDDDDDARAAARAARRSSADYDDEEGGESGRASSPTGEEGEEGDEEEAEGAAAGSGGGALGGRSAAAAAEEASAERAFVTRLDALCRPGGSLVGAGVASDGLSGWIDCRMPARTARLQLVPLVEELAPKVVVRHTEGITSAVVLPPPKGSKAPVIQTAGVNFGALASSRAMAAVVDLNKVRSNDIYAVLCTFGVEAARATIVSEIKSVFGVYGIKVDPRHLALIGDYMTHEGGYTPLNRSGMETHVSPMLKMTFETTTHFLTQAATHGDPDPLTAPSAAIVLGKPVSCGTGAFGLRANLAACRQ